FGEDDDAAVDVQASVAQVGDLEAADVSGAQSVEGDQGDDGGLGDVAGVEGLPDGVEVGGDGLAGFVFAGLDAAGRVGEQDLVFPEHAEDGLESLSGGGSWVAGGGQGIQDVLFGDLAQGGVPAGGPCAQ